MSHLITLLSRLLRRVGGLRVRAGIRRAVRARVAYILVILSLLTQNSAQATGLSGAPGLSVADRGAIQEQMTQIDPELYSLVVSPFPSDSTGLHDFGYSASLSGGTLVVGDPGYDVAANFAAGAAYVFSRNQARPNAWGEVTRLTAFDGKMNGYFGFSVSANGDIIVVGAYNADGSGGGFDGKGAAYVFSRNQGGPNAWGLVAKLIAFDRNASDWFGRAVSVSGDTIVVGAPLATHGDSNGPGAVYVFNRDPVSGVWNPGPTPKLTAFDGAAGDEFGGTVSISGDTIFVGAVYADIGGITNRGAAYIFSRDPVSGVWNPGPKLIASDGATLGGGVSVSGDTAVVSGSVAEGASLLPAVYVYNRDPGNNSWQQVTQLIGALDEAFGTASASESTIIVGAPWATIDGIQQNGAAYVFSRNQGGPNHWGRVDKLVGGYSMRAHFGGAVAVSGNTVAVGAPGGGSLHPEGEAFVYAACTGSSEITRLDEGLLEQKGINLSQPLAAQPYEILMESRRFVPDSGMEASVLDLAATGATGPTHLLLQFYETPTEGQKEQLKAQGIELLHYIPNNAWIASVQPSALAALSSNPSIRWGGGLTSQDRTSSLIADETLRAFYANKDKTLPLMVEFAGDVSLDQAKEIVARFGGVVKSEVISINSLLIYLPPRKFDALTKVDEIIWVEPALLALEALNDCLRRRIGGNTIQAAPYNLNGSGVDLLVYDAGTVATTHSGFTGRLSVKDSSGQDDHATHVAGTAAGSGAGSPSGRNLKGMAPAARILSYGFEGFAPGWLYTNPGDIEHDWNQAKNSFGADLGTASIGTNTAGNGFPCEWEGNYGEVAQLLDAIVRGSLGEPYIATWAAGNERGGLAGCGSGFGTTAPPAGAKNPIHVGATNSDTDEITSFSSFGPTDDGRIKPTISAPGCQQGGDGAINSALPPDTYGTISKKYDIMCGTSMATPAVAGLIALMIQQYRTTSGTGGEPWPSSVKAILIHTAVDKGNAGPDYQYGYGRVNGVGAINMIKARNFRQETITVTGEYHNYSYSHAGGDLKVSLAWDDAPATPSAAVQLVNDLDLVLVSPSNQVFRPFILNPANPGLPATTGADHLNNQEQIIVPDAATGTWTIQVRAQNLPVASQRYSIVFKGAGTTTPTKVRMFTAAVQDGWVLESTETSNVGGTMDANTATFNVGDAAGDKQYRGILSFNTASLPDNAVVRAVTFKLLRQGIVGTNPFTTHGNLLMDIIRGAFSGSAALQLADFQSAANRNGVVIPNSSPGGWYSVNLPADALTFVNKVGVTQVRLRFTLDDNDDLAADFIRFFSGNGPADNRPKLIIQYRTP